MKEHLKKLIDEKNAKLLEMRMEINILQFNHNQHYQTLNYD